MPITPLDIHNKEFSRSFRGYNPEEVDEFLDEIVRELDNVLQENQTLKDQAEEMRSRVEQYRQMEDTLQHTLVIAQETAEEVRENARKEAQVTIGEARADIRRLRAEADQYVDRIKEQGKEARSRVLRYLARARANLLTEMEILEKARDELDELGLDDESGSDDK